MADETKKCTYCNGAGSVQGITCCHCDGTGKKRKVKKVKEERKHGWFSNL